MTEMYDMAVIGGGPGGYVAALRGQQLGLTVALAEKERALVEWELKERRRRLIFEVQNTFIDVMVAREHRNVAGENLSFMKRIVGVNEARLKAGDLSEVEVIRSQVAAEQMESALQQAELALRLSQNRLLLLMGRSGESGLPEADGEFRRDSETASPQEARQSALAGRPDLRAAAAEEERAEADLALQKALRRGDLELGTEYRRQQGVNGMGNSLGFTVNVPLPLFDRNQGELARAAAERNRAALRTAALRAAILSEVATALDQQATARQQLERIESVLLKKAREVREVTEYAYQRGEASLLELLDAEKAYMETMQSYALARAEYSRSSYWIDAVTAKDGSK